MKLLVWSLTLYWSFPLGTIFLLVATLHFTIHRSSWERGTNENMNRMICRFVPKGVDISMYGKSELKRIQEWLNNYPRKILNYRMSTELLIWLHNMNQKKRET